MADEENQVNEEDEQEEPESAEESTDEEDSEIEEVETSMQDEQEEDSEPVQPIVKEEGEFYGTGRRKESVARVWVESGNGEIIVNEEDVESYFTNRPMWIQSVKAPLETLGFEENINVWATAEGGGLTGQADALKLGIARALVDMDENARGPLRSDGHLTRDDRQVERKKINQPGARKKQQVSKR